MAAKGSVLKQEIAQKILTAFPGSFLYNDGKEIRINGMEDGVQLQVKCVLTCAKTPVENEDAAVAVDTSQVSGIDINPPATGENIPDEPSKEEKERLAALINRLGL
jgi:hypothetical protein